MQALSKATVLGPRAVFASQEPDRLIFRAVDLKRRAEVMNGRLSTGTMTTPAQDGPGPRLRISGFARNKPLELQLQIGHGLS